MVDPKEIFQQIEGEVDNLLGMYALAEKAYPYSNLHGERADNENQ